MTPPGPALAAAQQGIHSRILSSFLTRAGSADAEAHTTVRHTQRHWLQTSLSLGSDAAGVHPFVFLQPYLHPAHHLPFPLPLQTMVKSFEVTDLPGQ
jgi:hypothetical protein